MVNVNRGTDFSFSFNWPNGEGGKADLTDFTVTAYEINPDQTINVEITNPSEGLITVEIPWVENRQINSNLDFRIMIEQDGVKTTTNIISVRYE
jgi:hypothetical protein